MIRGIFLEGQVVLEKSDPALVFVQRGYGSLISGSIYFSLHEAYYLYNKKKLIIVDKRDKEISLDKFWKYCVKFDKQFFVKYSVFANLRSRGYLVQSGLKFGAEFRVYDKGVKPGDDHAKWIVFPVAERDNFSWHEFSAKNRVAHSTRKKLLIGVVGEDGEPTYYEIAWLKP